MSKHAQSRATRAERVSWASFLDHWLHCSRCVGDRMAVAEDFCVSGQGLLGVWRRADERRRELCST